MEDEQPHLLDRLIVFYITIRNFVRDKWYELIKPRVEPWIHGWIIRIRTRLHRSIRAPINWIRTPINWIRTTWRLWREWIDWILWKKSLIRPTIKRYRRISRIICFILIIEAIREFCIWRWFLDVWKSRLIRRPRRLIRKWRGVLGKEVPKCLGVIVNFKFEITCVCLWLKFPNEVLYYMVCSLGFILLLRHFLLFFTTICRVHKGLALVSIYMLYGWIESVPGPHNKDRDDDNYYLERISNQSLAYSW